jgi:subtilisin family serine protease
MLASRMRRSAFLPLVLAFVAVTASAEAAPTTGRLLVSLRQPDGARARAAAVRAFAASVDARAVGRPVPQIGLVTVRPHPGESLKALAARLRADPRVRAVSAERRATFRADPGDPALHAPEQAAGVAADTPVEWWPAREGFTSAWDITKGDGALVGLIDSGVDGSHPEFAGKIERADDVDGNPAHGPATTDEMGHGTDVASLACAATGNGIGLAGAGWNCKLIVEKSDLTDTSVARSIVQATDAGADAINMSFGTDGRTEAPQPVLDAVDYAYQHNVVLVAAAADDSVQEQGDPANALQPTGTGPDINAGKGLSVTIATAADRRASYGGYGSQISVAAYGTYDERTGPGGLFGAFPAQQTDLERGSLTPPTPPCRCRTTFQGDSRYAYQQGTSFAAPQVAALGALIRHLNPDLGVARVLRIIKETARRAPGGWTPDLGWGIIDAGAAVAAASRIDVRPPTATVIAPRRTHQRRITLRLKGTDTAPPGVTASGIARFRVLRSVGGRAPVKIAVTPRSTVLVRVRPGTTYSFYVQAVDKAGNVQPLTAQPSARVRALA